MHKKATIVCAPDPSTVSKKIKWWAVFRGLPIVLPAVLLSGEGAVIAYQKAIQTERHIFCTAKFREKSNATVEIIQACMESPGSKWKFIHTISDLMERINKFDKLKRCAVIAAIRHNSEDKDSLMM